jgi:hypothetical protein
VHLARVPVLLLELVVLDTDELGVLVGRPLLDRLGDDRDAGLLPDRRGDLDVPCDASSSANGLRPLASVTIRTRMATVTGTGKGPGVKSSATVRGS